MAKAATQIETAGPELPRELQIWNGMTVAQRAAVMQAVGYRKSMTKWFRACMAYIRRQQMARA